MCKTAQKSRVKVIVATSKEKSDDKLEAAYQGKINYFRGSLKDVFSRYLSIAKNKDDDLILRATVDNLYLTEI